jgi:hypothetical protein
VSILPGELHSSNTLTLENGTRTITSQDITGVRDLWFRDGYEGLTIRGGQYPPDAYRCCLAVCDSGSGRVLGSDCIDVEVGGVHPQLLWWQCDKDKGHFWQGTEEQRRCPVRGCGGTGEDFEPPDVAQLYWNGDSLVTAVHVNQDMTVREVKVVVSWVSKNGRQAADAVLLRTYDPPAEHHLCDTLPLRAAWPSDFQPTGSIRPPAKGKLNLEKTKVKVLVNGQVIAEGRLPAANPPE